MRAMHDCLYHKTIWVLNMQFASFSAIFKYLVSIYSAFQSNLQTNIKKTAYGYYLDKKKQSVMYCTRLRNQRDVRLVAGLMIT